MKQQDKGIKQIKSAGKKKKKIYLGIVAYPDS